MFMSDFPRQVAFSPTRLSRDGVVCHAARHIALGCHDAGEISHFDPAISASCIAASTSTIATPYSSAVFSTP